jgi:DNA polymerase-3 subunit gamma/tau
MASQSLYRKWRSQSFSDLVGQEPIVRTLCHAVRDDRLAHAYLFCGPRGTGKTSMARLLAKAINCANPHEGEPCNQCLSCREIAEGRSPDVFEIDAASNNGVDNIRDLRENANVLSGGRYKIYIVDEVHMLSTQAFNALLKTLEEPPPHVLFILATTEAHKVLATIVSRCQRFDFRRISQRDIVARLHHVAEGEGVGLDPAAADLLARAAQGGLRDALSLMDQAMAFCGGEITLEGVRGMLGLADPGAIRALVEHVASGRAAEGLHLINDLVSAGADLRQLNSQLAEYWRGLLLARAGADVAHVMDRGEEEARELGELARHFTLEELAACARIFAANDTPARGLPVPQLGLELSFLECLGVRRRGAAPVASAQPTAPMPQPGSTPARPQPTPAPAAAPDAPRPPAPAPATMPRPAAVPMTDGVDELDLAALEDDPPGASQPARVAASAQRASTSRPDEPQRATAAEQPPSFSSGGGVAAMAGGTPAEALPGRTPAAEMGVGEWLQLVQTQWGLVKKVCKQRKQSTAALLHSARPIMVAPGNPLEVVLQADYQFHLEKLREPTSRADVEWALAQVLEIPCRIRLVQAGGNGPGGAGSASDAGGPAGRGAGAPGRVNGNGWSGSPGPRGMNGGGNGASPAPAPQASVPGEPLNGAGSPTQATPPQPPTASANGASAPTVAREPGELRPGPVHKGNGTSGHNGATSKAASTGMRDATFAYTGATGPAAGRTIEEEARADPVVREILRTYPAEVAEVRPIEPDDAD